MARDLSVNSKIVDSDQYVYREERDITKTQVDWDTVTKDLTKTIETIRDDRETRKSEIQEATTKSINDLAEMEQYDSESLNVKVLQGSQWGSEFLTSQNTLMKRGFIKASDFMQSKQKVSDSFTQLKSALGKFDAEYKEGQERMNSQVPGEQSNVMEQGIKLGMSGLAGLSQWDFAGNPATGDMNFVKKGTDASNPANLMSLNSINQRLTQKSDYVSLTTSTSEEILRLGVQIDSSFITDGGRGSVESIESWLEIDGSQGMLDSLVGVVTSTESQQISILQDAGVTAKMMTQDPEEAAANPGSGTAGDPGYVLMVPNGDGQGTLQAELSPLQQGLVDKEAEKIIRSQLDKKIELAKGHQTVFKPQDNTPTVKKKEADILAAGYMQDVVDLTEGTQEQAESAATALAISINKVLGKDDAAVTLIERVEGANGQTVSFQIHREGMETSVVDVEDMTPANAQRALYENVTPQDVPGYHQAMDAWGGTPGDAYGEGGVQGRGPVETMSTLDFESAFNIPGAGETTTWAYIDSELGETLNSANDSEAESLAVYKNVLTSIMPQDLFDAVGGSENVQVYYDGETLVIKIGEGEDMVKKTVAYSYGKNDSTRLHLDTIQEAVSEAREKAIAKRSGVSTQSSFDDWRVENPEGTFAEWSATQ